MCSGHKSLGLRMKRGEKGGEVIRGPPPSGRGIGNFPLPLVNHVSSPGKEEEGGNGKVSEKKGTSLLKRRECVARRGKEGTSAFLKRDLVALKGSVH